MMAVPAAALPAGPDWTYEVKWDGYRAQIVKDGATVSLASRNLKNITTQYPAIAHAASRLAVRTALLDGEIVASMRRAGHRSRRCITTKDDG
jgi:bifunctional non-homologous end joining protein LigD